MQAQAQYDRAESSGDFALPVTLTAFSASGGENSIVLQWTTASEVDLIGFNLYRSREPVGGFERINPAVIPAQGTGPEINEYHFIDVDVSPGCCYYYRLSTFELDGSETFIGTTIMGSASNFYGNLSIALKGCYPDPFNSQVSIAFSVNLENRITLTVYDTNGCKVATLIDRVLAPGQYVETFHGDHLPSGMYLCRMQSASGYDQVRRMILLR